MRVLICANWSPASAWAELEECFSGISLASAYIKQVKLAVIPSRKYQRRRKKEAEGSSFVTLGQPNMEPEVIGFRQHREATRIRNRREQNAIDGW